MNPFEEVTDAPAGSEEWLKARLSGIGASEIASVLGLSPHRSALEVYAQKIGADENEETSEDDWNESMKWGLLLEPIVRDEFARRTSRVVLPAGVLIRSCAEPWALATPDAWVVNGSRWPLQIKTTAAHRANDWDEGPPEHIMAQIQHEILVSGADKATVACLIGGQRMVWQDIEADVTWRNRIVRAGREFWGLVEKRIPPAPDGSPATKKRLGKMFPEGSGEVVQLGTEFADLDAELCELKKAAKTSDTRIGEIENTIRAAIGPATVAVLPDGTTYAWNVEPRAGYTVEPTRPRVLRRRSPKRKE